jgi:beta-mannanase
MDGNDTYGSGYGDAPWDSNTWNLFESHAGKKVSIVHWGTQPPWTVDFNYQLSMHQKVFNAGDLELLSMDSGSVPLRDITAGKYDSSLTTWALEAKAFGHPFFLRWDWEMNGSWFSWGTTSSNQNTPADYVSSWRHIHDIFTQVGATNVTWAWCPNLEFSGSTPLSQLYPGDAYVDWTCLDGYNKDTNSTSFATLYGQSYNDLSKIAPSKPIMIAEMSSLEYAAGTKANWITDALSTQLPTKFTQIKALVWMNWRMYENGTWWPWQIESSSSAQAAFASAISSPYYAAGGNLATLPLLAPIKPLP